MEFFVLPRTRSCLLLGSLMLATACASELDAIDKGDESPLPIDGAADSANAPTDHGALGFGASADAVFTASAQHHAWTFTVERAATVAMRTLAASDGEIDTVIYLYREQRGRWGNPIQRDDDALAPFSQIEQRLQPGRYRIVVKGYDTSVRGGFRVQLECAACGGAPVDDRRTFERPGVGMLVDSLNRRCTATLVRSDVVITAAHCVQENPYETQEGAWRGTFTIERSATERATYNGIWFAAYGRTFDIAFVVLDRDVPADIPRATLAERAPLAGEPMERLGYGCTNPETREGGGVKRFFRYAYGASAGRTCFGDSGGPTFGPAGLHMITSGEDSQQNAIQIFVSEWLPQLDHKLAEFAGQPPTECPEGTRDDYARCAPDGRSIARCWLGYVVSEPCAAECLSESFEEEDAVCAE